MTAVETTEEIMRTYSITELFRLSRSELLALHAQILAELAHLADADPGAVVARDNLRRIREVLSRPRPQP